MATWPVLSMHAQELRRADAYGPLVGDEIVPVYSPYGHGRQREGSLPISFIQPHIVRHVVGTSDCPMVERNVPGESVNNAAKLKLALETYGWLDAGPFGAAYDLAFTAPDMINTPIVAIEGNGSQEFHGLEADLNNSPLLSISPVVGGSATQYGPTAVMFSFEGILHNQGTLTVSIDWGGEAHLKGVKIIGPPLASGVDYWNNVICGRMIDRLFVEDCEMYGWSSGAMIAATAVRHGGSISHNRLHDMNCIHVRPPDGDWKTQATAILIDDNKPNDGTLVVQDLGSAPLLNYIAKSDGFLIEENAVTDLVDHGTRRQTDAINIQVQSSNHRISGGVIRNTGDAIDCWGHSQIIHGVRIDDCHTGLKLINGFRNGNVSNCTISNCEMWGIYISASGRSALPTEDNIITGCHVSRINMANAPIGASALEIAYSSSGSTAIGAVSRLFVTGNTFDPLGTATVLSLRGEGDSQTFTNNVELVRGNAVGVSNSHLATNSNHRAANETVSFNYLLAYLPVDQNNITGNAEIPTIGGWNEFTDTANEFDSVTGIYTVNALGNYRISFQLTFKGVSSSITSLVVFVSCWHSVDGVNRRDWTFVGDPNTVSGDVTVSGVVDEKFVVAGGSSIRLLVRAIGDATSPVGLKSVVGGNLRYSNFTVTKV